VVFFGNKLRQPYQGLAIDIGCYGAAGDWEIAIERSTSDKLCSTWQRAVCAALRAWRAELIHPDALKASPLYLGMQRSQGSRQ
jgi:hypothetical protein